MKLFFLILIVQLSSCYALQKEVHIVGHGGETFKQVLNSNNDGKYVNLPDRKDIVEINQDSDLFLSTIQRSKAAMVTDPLPTLWNDSVVPVRYNSSLGLQAISAIESARVEFELRTCLCFSDYSDEEDYLDIQALDGCYSSVGRQGGMQTVSIGKGCEQTAIVEHELMHALGVYNEQSRPDRDDYVEIELQNVEAGEENKFSKENYYLVNKDLAPYDYESVMHYGSTEYSSNGNITIRTLDSSKHDVIGQRRTFSTGDTSELSYVYSCDSPKRMSYTCSFEEPTTCNYTLNQDNTADFIRYDLTKDQPPSLLPQTDATFALLGKGSFMGITFSNTTKTEFNSPIYTSNSQKSCIEYKYYVKGTIGLGMMIFAVDKVRGEMRSSNEVRTELAVDQENMWSTTRLSFKLPKHYRLQFSVLYIGSNGSVGAAAFDDVNVIDRPCESDYFIVQNYTNLLANTAKGESFFGKKMYTEDDYAFQIEVYPNGSNDSEDGYMALYYYPVQGYKDYDLKWPFEHRVIKLSVVDQNSNALIRMNQNQDFLTDDTDIDWGRPTENPKGVGFPNFMKISDLTETKDFMKYDSVIIAIDVTDMTDWIGQYNETRGIVRPLSSFKVDCKDQPTTTTAQPTTISEMLTSSTESKTTTKSQVITTSNQGRIGASVELLGLAAAFVQLWLR